MASNNYTSANVTPSSDTFREWVDLTNRITYDMEKRVVTTALHSVGGGTTGNAYVNGFFSANTLYITDSISGAKTDDGSNVVGANSTVANVIFSSNVVFVANSTANAIIHAQSNVHISGSLLDVDAVIDIDNTNTDITSDDITLAGPLANLDSTTTNINGTTLNIDSATVDVDSATAVNFNSPDVGINGALLDINSTTVDVDNALTDINATDFNLSGSTADVTSATLTVDGTTANLDSTTTNINGTTLDIDSATVDVDSSTLVDIDAPIVNISGTTATVDSINMNIHGTSLDINSNTNIDGIITTTANATIGNANSDILTVNSDTTLTDKLNVQEAVDLDKTLNVDGAATFNADVTLGNANTDSVNFIAEVSSGISPEANTQALGLDDARWILKANTINASAEANLNSLVVVTDTSLEGDTVIGNQASADTVNVEARVISSIEPTANGKVLGHADRRWDLRANNINVFANSQFSANVEVAGDIIGAADIDMSGEANLFTLIARSTSRLVGHVNAAANVNIETELRVKGDSFFHYGNTDGLITITDSNITVGSGSVNTAITPTSINTDGTLTVLRASALSNTLNVTGATVLGNTVSVTNTATFSNTIAVTGAATFSNTVGVTNSASFSNTVAIVGPATLSNTISVANNATVTGTLGVTRATTLANTLAVTGTSTLTGDVTAAGNIKAASANVSGHTNAATLGATGAVDFDSTLNVDGATTLGDTLAVTNTAVLSNTLSVAGKSTLASANVTGGLQANGAVDFNSTGNFEGNVVFQDSITVTDNSTFSGTLAAGSTTVSGFVNASGNIKAASANISGHSNLATIGASGAVSLGSTLGVLGLGTFNDGTNVTGTANVIGTSAAMHIGSHTDHKVRIANNEVKLGNSTVRTVLTSSSINTSGTLIVGGVTTLNDDVESTGNIKVASANVAGHSNVDTLGATGAVDFDSTLNVDGATTLNGGVKLGNATADILQLKGRANTNFVPEANDTRQLGTSSLRWKGAFSTINASSSGIIGSSLTVNGTTNSTSNTTGALTSAGGLGVKKSVTIGEKLKVFSDTDIDGNLTVGPGFSVSSNEDHSTVTSNTVSAQHLTITGSASLPSDTTLSLNEADIVDLDVSANADFGKTTSVQINFGGDPAGRATVNLTNSHFTNTMALDHRLQVGSFVTETGSGNGTGSQLTNTTLETDVIRARSDLIANYSSDQRLKDQVIKIDTALNKVEEIGGYQFTWNNNVDDHRAGTIDYGVIAQEVEEILPQAVGINNRGYKTVNYNSLIPLLIEAVKELSGRVKDLEKGEE